MPRKKVVPVPVVIQTPEEAAAALANHQAFLARMVRNKNNMLRWAPAFSRTFGIRINEYWDGPLYGFNILKFDDWLGRQWPDENTDTMSMADIVKKHYDNRGVAIIKGLLGSGPARKRRPLKQAWKLKRKSTQKPKKASWLYEYHERCVDFHRENA